MRLAYALIAGLVACAPPAATPVIKAPALPAQFAASRSGAASIGTVDWHTFFGDPQLGRLIQTAIERNLDLRVAVQRIEVARAHVLRASGARLPTVGLFADASLQKFGRYTMDGAGNASTEIRPGQAVPTHLPDMAFGLEASWEPDLWGRVRNLTGAAQARYLASVEGTHLVISNLVADVAATYFELLSIDRKREILTATIARQTQALEVMRVEKEAGRTNELAVQRFAAELEASKALEAQSLRRARELEHRMSLLLGTMPGPIARNVKLLAQEVPQTFAAGVPSDLLRNRPDIRSAELEVQAARLSVSAARAAFYPRINISAAIGYDAFNPRFLLTTPASLAYRVAGSLFAPLVNRRAIRADLALSEATQVEAMYRYQSVVLRAFIDVASGLADIEQAAEVVARHRARLAAVTSAVSAADALFRAGKATYLEVLLAQQSALDAELEVVTALRDQRLAMVRLYKALGGGWRGTLRTLDARAQKP